MDNKKMDFDKSELIKKLEILRELEVRKPLSEMDTDFIDEVVLFGLELKGLKTTLTPEEVEEKVRKIPFVDTASLNTPPTSVKSRATKVKSRKILLIAAIISILVAIFAVTSIAFKWNIFDELKNRFGTVADTPVNQEIDVKGFTVIMHGETFSFDGIEEFLEKENFNILYPEKLPESIVLKQAVLQQNESKDKIAFIFNDTDFTFYITFDNAVSDEVINGSTEIIELNGKMCYITDIADMALTQIYFVHNGDLYYFSYNDKQDLINVIENLKELQ